MRNGAIFTKLLLLCLLEQPFTRAIPINLNIQKFIYIDITLTFTKIRRFLKRLIFKKSRNVYAKNIIALLNLCNIFKQKIVLNFVCILFHVMLGQVCQSTLYISSLVAQIFLGKSNAITFFRRERRALYVVIEQTTICT